MKPTPEEQRWLEYFESKTCIKFRPHSFSDEFFPQIDKSNLKEEEKSYAKKLFNKYFAIHNDYTNSVDDIIVDYIKKPDGSYGAFIKTTPVLNCGNELGFKVINPETGVFASEKMRRYKYSNSSFYYSSDLVEISPYEYRLIAVDNSKKIKETGIEGSSFKRIDPKKPIVFLIEDDENAFWYLASRNNFKNFLKGHYGDNLVVIKNRDSDEIKCLIDKFTKEVSFKGIKPDITLVTNMHHLLEDPEYPGKCSPPDKENRPPGNKISYYERISDADLVAMFNGVKGGTKSINYVSMGCHGNIAMGDHFKRVYFFSLEDDKAYEEAFPFIKYQNVDFPLGGREAIESIIKSESFQQAVAGFEKSKSDKLNSGFNKLLGNSGQGFFVAENGIPEGKKHLDKKLCEMGLIEKPKLHFVGNKSTPN